MIVSCLLSACYNFRVHAATFSWKGARELKRGRVRQGGIVLCALSLWIGLTACSKRESHLFGKAEGAQRVGSYAQAVELYNSYLQKYPTGEFAEKSHYNLGNIYYLNLRDSAQARLTYEKFLEKFPTSQYGFTAGERLAELYELDLQDYRRAIDVLEQISLRTPSRGDWRRVRFRIADDYFRLDEFDQAVLEFKKLITDEPVDHRSDEARAKIAAIYEIRKQWPEAIKQLVAVIAQTKCSECLRHAQFEIVDCYASMEHYDQAIAALKQIPSRPEDRDFLAQRLAVLEQNRRDKRSPREVDWRKQAPRRRKPPISSRRPRAAQAGQTSER